MLAYSMATLLSSRKELIDFLFFPFFGFPKAHVLVSELGQVKGSDFEAVDESSLTVNADSGQAIQPGLAPNPTKHLRIQGPP